ncbi:unnamed protein product [Amoebophrya sp. A120]|nr:unnamed protein product [Amoebophrya sp. A120]|eukprot:GSA120T00025909001.1
MPPAPGYLKFLPNRGVTIEDRKYVFLCVHDDSRVFITEMLPEDEMEAGDLTYNDQHYIIKLVSKYDRDIHPDSDMKIMDEATFAAIVDLFYDHDDHYTEQSPSHNPSHAPTPQSEAPSDNNPDPPVQPGQYITFDQMMQFMAMMNNKQQQVGQGNNSGDSSKKYITLFKDQPVFNADKDSLTDFQKRFGDWKNLVENSRDYDEKIIAFKMISSLSSAGKNISLKKHKTSSKQHHSPPVVTLSAPAGKQKFFRRTN